VRTITLHDTKTGALQPLQPRDPGRVGIYACGPTVYGRIHVGNARPFVVFSLLKRFLVHEGYEVTFVANVTDVNDKIYDAARARGVRSDELAREMTAAYVADTDALGLGRPDHEPRASETIPQIVELISQLIARGHAYAVDGDVYFDVRSYPRYGELSHRDVAQMDQGEGGEGAERKRDPLDFALWKATKPGEDTAWDAPWGRGRPGWHIECSAMNLKELGEQIDIHGGGTDLIFPHHENEIAQSESLTGKPFARYWMHNGMLQIQTKLPDGTYKLEKMSKSLGNVVTIRDFLAEYPADVLRLVVLSSSYRSPLAYGKEIAADNLRKLARIRSALEPAIGTTTSGEQVDRLKAAAEAAREQFIAAMDDDFNTSGALAAIFELVRAINTARDAGVGGEPFEQAQGVLRELTGVLGLTLEDTTRGRGKEAEPFIELLVELRSELRKARQFQLADMIRTRLGELGVTLEDTPQGTRWKI